MNNIKVVLGLTAALTSAITLADPSIYQSQGFEYKAELHTTDSLAIQSMELPESVQRQLYNAQGQDIKVYNGNDELIPSIVKYGGAERVDSIKAAVRFYPLKPDDSISTTTDNVNTSPEVAVNLQLNMNINTNISQSQALNSPQSSGSYILENPQHIQGSDLPGRLQRLDFTWDDVFKGIATLKLESSNDLNHWKTLIAKDTLVDMYFMDQHLSKNSLPLLNQAEKYIKLSWIGDNRPVLTNIQAIFSQKSEDPDYHWSQNLKLTQVTDKKSLLTLFESTVSPSFKSNRFRLITTQDNQIYSGFLSNKATKSAYKNKQYPFRFYKIMTSEGELSNLEQAINTQSNSLWRFYFKHPSNPNISNLPNIQVNRYPLRLYFLKQGEGPFYLAYANKKGIDNNDGVKNIVTSLIKQPNTEFGVATLGAVSNIEKLKPSPKSIDWKQILLWLVLGGGVLIMLVMARSLFKEINTKSNN